MKYVSSQKQCRNPNSVDIYKCLNFFFSFVFFLTFSVFKSWISSALCHALHFCHHHNEIWLCLYYSQLILWRHSVAKRHTRCPQFQQCVCVKPGAMCPLPCSSHIFAYHELERIITDFISKIIQRLCGWSNNRRSRLYTQ